MDAEEKTRRIKALRKGAPEALPEAIAALNDPDPIIQEWATVALRNWRGDKETARTALLAFFDDHDREALRCYALEALGRLGMHLPVERIPELVLHHHDTPKPMVLGWALSWIGRVGIKQEDLARFLELPNLLPQDWPGLRGFRERHSAALNLFAKRMLETKVIDKEWLRARGGKHVLDAIGETRIETAILARMHMDSQKALLPPEELEEALQDEPLVPGRPLADTASHYAQDLAELAGGDRKIAERVLHLRNQAIVREAKRLAGYRCQIHGCGTGLPASSAARRFVHAHHVKPLGQGGEDEIGNLVVVCPNCHSRVHCGLFDLGFEEGTWTLKRKSPGLDPAEVAVPAAPARVETTADIDGDLDDHWSVIPGLSQALALILLQVEQLEAADVALLRCILEPGEAEIPAPKQFQPMPPEIRDARAQYLLELFRNSEKPEAEQLRLAAEARKRLGVGPHHGVFVGKDG